MSPRRERTRPQSSEGPLAFVFHLSFSCGNFLPVLPIFSLFPLRFSEEPLWMLRGVRRSAPAAVKASAVKTAAAANYIDESEAKNSRVLDFKDKTMSRKRSTTCCAARRPGNRINAALKEESRGSDRSYRIAWRQSLNTKTKHTVALTRP